MDTTTGHGTTDIMKQSNNKWPKNWSNVTMIQSKALKKTVWSGVSLSFVMPAYLNEPVLRAESGSVCGRPRVQRADVLAGTRPLAVEVETVTHLGPHQVAQAGNELWRVDRGPRLGLSLSLGFGVGQSLLEDRKRDIGFVLEHTDMEEFSSFCFHLYIQSEKSVKYTHRMMTIIILLFCWLGLKHATTLPKHIWGIL